MLLCKCRVLGLLSTAIVLLLMVGCAPPVKRSSISARSARHLAASALKDYCSTYSVPTSRFGPTAVKKSWVRPDGTWTWLFIYGNLDPPYYDLMMRVSNTGNATTTRAVGKQEAAAIAAYKFSDYIGWEHSAASDYEKPVLSVNVSAGDTERVWSYQRKHIVGKPYTITVDVYEDGVTNVSRH